MNCDLISLSKKDIGVDVGVFVSAHHVMYLEPLDVGTMIMLSTGVSFAVREDAYTIRRKMLNEVPSER